MKSASEGFAILPWEHRGAFFDAAAHAFTSVEIAKRKFSALLKMREGIIYFKDPKRVPLFAIPHRFEGELKGDDLIVAFHEQVKRGNYGRFFWRHLNFSETAATSAVVCIHRPDFSGWISDAFHIAWHETPRHRDGRVLNMWKDDIGDATWRAIKRVRDPLFDRELEVGELQELVPRWASGDEAGLRRLFAAIMQLYVRREGSDSTRTWTFHATNPTRQGGFLHSFNAASHVDLTFSPTFFHLLRLLNEHFVWVGMKWEYNSYVPNSPTLRESAQKWGDKWRGHYRIDTPTFDVMVPIVASLSQHQRLEHLLELRDWLEDKVSARQTADWIAQAFD